MLSETLLMSGAKGRGVLFLLFLNENQTKI